ELQRSCMYLAAIRPLRGGWRLVVFDAPAAGDGYTLSLHDAFRSRCANERDREGAQGAARGQERQRAQPGLRAELRRLSLPRPGRSEEHTSELQSLRHLVCRLLLEKKTVKLVGFLLVTFGVVLATR